MIEFHFILWSRQHLSVQQKYFTQFYSICLVVVIFQLKFWLKCVIKHFHQHKYPKRNWILWKYYFSCIESTTFVFNFSNHFTSSSYNPYENLFKCLFSVYFQHLCCTYFFLLFIICFTIDTLSERNWFEYKSYKQKVLLFGSTFQLNFIYQNKFKTQINVCS